MGYSFLQMLCLALQFTLIFLGSRGLCLWAAEAQCTYGLDFYQPSARHPPPARTVPNTPGGRNLGGS